MIKATSDTRSHLVEFLIHLIGWGIVFAFPVVMLSRTGSGLTWGGYLRHSTVLFAFFVVFYANYFLLIPHYLFEGRTRHYLLLNAALIAFVALGLQMWQDFLFALPPVRREAGAGRPMPPPRWSFFLRDIMSMALVVGLCAAIRLSRRWTQIEAARQEAEKSRTEAELKNLRSQLNPHFLLNTLNNIYALIAFDTEKAQQAVQDLSRLLRHLLYDNNQEFIPLNREIEFLRNYVALMKIRLSANVDLKFSVDVPPEDTISVAPLLFISLIENAFKHGVSTVKPSFIHIRIYVPGKGRLTCRIENSCFPKKRNDISGSGIGLEQVQKRLDLSYPGKYEWSKGVDGTPPVYTSTLTLQTN